MATLIDATFAGHKRGRAITVAAILFVWTGLATLISNLLIVISALRTGALPVMFGIDFLAGPISERFGVAAALAGTIPWAVVNVLEVLAGYWLWKSRKLGGQLGIVLFPVGLLFWIGYAIPFMAVTGPLRVLLIVVGWRNLRGRHDAVAAEPDT